MSADVSVWKRHKSVFEAIYEMSLYHCVIDFSQMENTMVSPGSIFGPISVILQASIWLSVNWQHFNSLTLTLVQQIHHLS